MNSIKCTIVVFSLIFHVYFTNCKLFDTSGALLSRDKRSLIFIEGVNWVQMIVGIGLPLEVKDQSITLGTAIKAFYLLPTNASDFTHPTIDYARKKRSLDRWIIYEIIEDFLQRYKIIKNFLI